ncbi:MAG: COX15/CtaA family protein [Sphingomonadaceae bacterium]|nr:COX15/CtaA family protein [Sphingomonadaceae bacterium]
MATASLAFDAVAGPRPLTLARWLFAVAALVFAMVVVGGITRLTESGLSITEWRPVTGVVPPVGEAQWQAEFAKYRKTYQYAAQNAGMTLSEFRRIWFWEWFHRLLGRLVGLAYAVPLMWFWWRRAIPDGFHARLLALLGLGALQGAVGWWMVTSGLWTDVRVSHLRLAVHLGIAFVILGGLVWTALDLVALGRPSPSRPARLTGWGKLALVALGVQVALGALVAGLRAGQVAASWPLMNGRWFPEGVIWAGPRTLIDDPFLVHFLHRWWALVAMVALVVLVRQARAAGAAAASVALPALVATQLLLGILVVVLGVPLWAAVAHQAVGALVVAGTVWAAHASGRR